MKRIMLAVLLVALALPAWGTVLYSVDGKDGSMILLRTTSLPNQYKLHGNSMVCDLGVVDKNNVFVECPDGSNMAMYKFKSGINVIYSDMGKTYFGPRTTQYHIWKLVTSRYRD